MDPDQNERNESCSLPPLRLGIMSAARIVGKNILAIQHDDSQSTACQIVGLASRSQLKIDALKTTYKLENCKFYAGKDAYEQLLLSDEVDAVYIPLPVSVKKQWIMRALDAKKHVLLEKPVALNSLDFQEMLYKAKEVGRYIMDGTMIGHNNRTKQLLAYTSTKGTEVGKITRINSEFSVMEDKDFFTNDIRAKKDGDPYGCLGDLGWYCVRISQLIFRNNGSIRKAKRAQATHWKINEQGVPLDASGLVFFQAENRNEDKSGNCAESILSFQCSFIHSLQQRFVACSETETLEIADLVLPKKGSNKWFVHKQNKFGYDSTSPQSRIDMETPAEPTQVALMWRDFSRDCRAVEKEGWGNMYLQEQAAVSLETQEIMDAIMESISHGGKSVNLSEMGRKEVIG